MTTLPGSRNGGVLSQTFFTPAPSLATSRYNRQLLIPDISLAGQKRIASTRVLIIGLGGLGSPASLYLAGAGVHTLGLVDHDVVEETNLHRQIVHRESSVFPSSSPSTSPPQENVDKQEQSLLAATAAASSSSSSSSMAKVQSALRGCRELNSSIQYRTYEVQLNGSNALDIIQEYDIVLDCTDNPATRYLISDVCVILSKVLVSGAAQKLDGQLMVLNYAIPSVAISSPASTNITASASVTDQAKSTPQEVPIMNDNNHSSNVEQHKPHERGPCYRCVFPVPPSPEMVQGCSEIGILGPVVGTIGCMMATEALRLICKPDEIRKPTALLYNAWSPDPRGMFRTIGLRGRRPDCVACGDEQTIQAKKGKQKISEDDIRRGIMDYQQFCGVVGDVAVLSADERMSADEFVQYMTGNNTMQKATIVDVREEIEVELGPKITNSISIPISKILRAPRPEAGHGSDNGLASEKDVLGSLLRDGPCLDRIIFVCQRGNDSQVAARKLIERGIIKEKVSWIGDVKGGFIEIEKLAMN